MLRRPMRLSRPCIESEGKGKGVFLIPCCAVGWLVGWFLSIDEMSIQ